jgi:hypothetical protein
MKFTIEKNLHEEIKYLELTINRKDTKLGFSIYRKPTQTDIVIPNSSCHRYEHKLLGIKPDKWVIHIYNKRKIKTNERTL